MTEIIVERSYIIVNRLVLSQFQDEVVGETGQDVTRTNSRWEPQQTGTDPDTGEPIYQNTLVLYEETIAEKKGGVTLVGRGGTDGSFSAILITSPNRDELIAIADQYPGSYFEIVAETVDSSNAEFEPEYPLLDELNVFLVGIDLVTVAGPTTLDALEQSFSQFSPDWTIGDTNIG